MRPGAFIESNTRRHRGPPIAYRSERTTNIGYTAFVRWLASAQAAGARRQSSLASEGSTPRDSSFNVNSNSLPRVTLLDPHTAVHFRTQRLVTIVTHTQ